MTRDERPAESVGSFDDEAPLRRPILATEEPKGHNWRVIGTIAMAVLVILAAVLLWRNAPGWMNFHAPSMPSWDLPYLPVIVKVLWWLLIITLFMVLIIMLLSRSFWALVVIAMIVTMGVLYSKRWQRPVVEVMATTSPTAPVVTPSVIATPPSAATPTVVPTPSAAQAQVTTTTPAGTATQASIAIDTSNLATKSDVAAVKTEVERLGAMLTAKKATATRTASKTTKKKTKPAYRELKSTVYIAVAKGGS